MSSWRRLGDPDRLSVVVNRGGAPLVIAFCHLAVAVLYTLVFGLDIQANPRARPWDWYWQAIPYDLLRDEAWRSIWHLHAQPPLFNAYAAVFFKAFREHPFQWMQAANILLGTALSAMMYEVLLCLTRDRRLAFAAGLLLAMNASLYLYEAFVLYDLLSAFLVVASIYALARYEQTRQEGYLPLFVLTVTLLALTRSIYHLAFVGVSIALVLVLAGRRWRSHAVAALLIAGLAAGWYAKNEAMFGFFGSSSWMGSSLWKIASAEYSEPSLRALARGGLFPEVVVDVPVFSPPSWYRQAVPDAPSSVAVLSRDDRHNLAYVAISKIYLAAASRLIRHDPAHYLRNVFEAYAVFSRPSSGYVQLSVNAAKIRYHEWLGAQVVQGEWLAERFGIRPFVFYLLPLALAGFLVWWWRVAGPSLSSWPTLLRRRPVLAYTFVIITYTTLIGITLEYGENHRFKFIIEQPLWAFVIAVAVLWARELGARGGADRSGGEPHSSAELPRVNRSFQRMGAMSRLDLRGVSVAGASRIRPWSTRPARPARRSARRRMPPACRCPS